MAPKHDNDAVVAEPTQERKRTASRSRSRSPSPSHMHLSQGGRSSGSQSSSSAKRRKKEGPKLALSQSQRGHTAYKDNGPFKPEDVRLNDWLEDVVVVERRNLKYDLDCWLGQSRTIFKPSVVDIR